MARNNPSVRIKVPIGLFRQANLRKLMPIVKYYYRVKTISIDGCFKETKFVNNIIYKLGISYNNARKIKASLLKHKFAYIKEDQLYLLSYEKLWHLLNVEKIGLNNTYKLIYTSNDKIDRHVHLAEIAYNLQKQQEKLDEKQLLKKLITDAEKNEALNKQFHLIRKKLTSKVSVNHQVTLSCKKVAFILGLKASSQGHHIIRSLVYSKKLSSVFQRSLVIKEGASYIDLKTMKLDPSFYLHDGVLKKRLPNLITIF